MAREITSKHIEGIADLVVVAPIKDGFIDAYETVTYETRLRIVSEALHAIRVSAREHEATTPFSDTTQRILTLLDFRIGILDRNLFELDLDDGLKRRRFLYLAATFDGAWEPYMRLIWQPLGDFLDLLFCNCEGYKPAGDHSFAEYAAWVRSAQVDSAIFYATTGVTVRDTLYLNELERKQRRLEAHGADLALAQMTMPDPDASAKVIRQTEWQRTIQLGLEALNVLYKLADYYPPDRVDPANKTGYLPKPPKNGPPANYTFAEGRYLLRAARNLLEEWDLQDSFPPGFPAEEKAKLERLFAEPLAWYRTDKKFLASQASEPADPPFDQRQVQRGILTGFGDNGQPVTRGAMVLLTATDPDKARALIKSLDIAYEGEGAPADGVYRSIAFTASGLRRLGMYRWKLDRFPKEFREGMEQRSGLLGDYRENHPRRWTLPPRNWPPAPSGVAAQPPVELHEVDFIVQLRHLGSEARAQAVLDAEIAALTAAGGVAIAGVEWLQSHAIVDVEDTNAWQTVDHFGFVDGLSQPKPVQQPSGGRDDVRLGEAICGYRNDRGDFAGAERGKMLKNGSFLAVRKIEQHAQVFADYLKTETARINADYDLAAKGVSFTVEDLAARIVGRFRDGRALVPTGPAGLNDFDFKDDPKGAGCPFASHIRRSNPRDTFQHRPAPRIVRRGMSWGKRLADDPQGHRGLMFMAYQSSIAEQFEVIQRWINGGNATNVSSAQNDPLIGVAPTDGERVFRFTVGDVVVRTKLPAFTSLHWGLYLFAPSRDAIQKIAAFQGGFPAIDELEEEKGRTIIERLEKLPPDVQRMEWKRILEDFDTRDPGEQGLAPDVWSAIRWYEGGSYRIESGIALASISRNRANDAAVLVGSRDHIIEVLSHPEVFSVAEQGERMHVTSGDIYVAMDPDERYWVESSATNAIMYAQSEELGFKTAYAAGKATLDYMIGQLGVGGRPFKLELRRGYLMPMLGAICTQWFGLPDGIVMKNGGWTWDKSPERLAHCPGDFLSPSRNAFNPKPSTALRDYALDHGPRIKHAGVAFVARCRKEGKMPGLLSSQMFAAINDDDVLARNIIGMMIGMLAPLEANLRSILYEWLGERTLWIHQAALRRAAKDGPTELVAAEVLRAPITRAVCKRPAPDLLFRIATQDYVLRSRVNGKHHEVHVHKGDQVILGLVSASQKSLSTGSFDGDLETVFGGIRTAGDQPYDSPTHACPARKLMTGTMMGTMAALLDVGRIQAQPAGLIVRISDWPQTAVSAAANP